MTLNSIPFFLKRSIRSTDESELASKNAAPGVKTPPLKKKRMNNF